MKRPHPNRRLVIALYANAALLFAILLTLMGHDSSALLPHASANPLPGSASVAAPAPVVAPPARSAPQGAAAPGGVAGQSPMPQGVASNDHLYIMPGELLNNVWGCYLLDLDHQTLCAYGYSGNQLKLYAARDIRFDHQLRNFNTAPDPQEIRRLIELEKSKVPGLHTPPTTHDQQPTTDH